VAGRFLSGDPLGNLYVYAADDPINGSDPLGLLCLPNLPNPVTNPLPYLVVAGLVILGGGPEDPAGDAAAVLELEAAEAASPVPSTLARVIPGGIPATTLGAPGAVDVFMTTSDAIAGLDSAGISQALTILESPAAIN
jgi:Novel toxin 10